MNETHLLTDAQIALRKALAIGLIGVGVALLPIAWSIFSDRINIYCIEQGWEVDYYFRVISIARWIYIVLSKMTVIAGCFLVCGLLDKSKSNFIKHWIVAYLLYFLCLLFSLHAIVWWLVHLLFWAYLIWAIDGVRKNGADPVLRKAVVFVQSALAMQLISTSFSWVYSVTLAYEEIGKFNNPGLLIDCLKWIIWIVVAIGMAKLIRSSLFASTSAQLEGFAGTSAPRTPIFCAPVRGAIASVILCGALTTLLLFFWNDIYNAF